MSCYKYHNNEGVEKGRTVFVLFFLIAFLPVSIRYSAPNHERAHASAPPGGTAGRARLHRGDAHPERLGYRRLLRCPVHTRDSREGRKRTHALRATSGRQKVDEEMEPVTHSCLPLSVLSYHSADMRHMLYWLHTRLPVKI